MKYVFDHFWIRRGKYIEKDINTCTENTIFFIHRHIKHIFLQKNFLPSSKYEKYFNFILKLREKNNDLFIYVIIKIYTCFKCRANIEQDNSA